MRKDRVPMLDIDCLMTGLAGSRKVFHTEADIQQVLAWQIHEAMPESHIRLGRLSASARRFSEPLANTARRLRRIRNK